MSYYEEYRETIDYTTVINRQWDRVSEAATLVGNTTNVPQRQRLKYYLFAVWTLARRAAIILWDEKEFERIEKKFLSLLKELEKDNAMVKVWLELGRIEYRIGRELDKRNILIRKRVLERGAFEGEETHATYTSEEDKISLL